MVNYYFVNMVNMNMGNVPYNNAEKKGMIFSKFQEHGY